MLLRLLISVLLNSIFGDPEKVQQDYKPWPTWVVVLLLILVLAGAVGIYAYFLL